MCDLALNPLGCVAGGAAKAVAGSAFDQFFQAIAAGTRDLLRTVSTFWMKVPSPAVASGSGQSWTGSQTIVSIQSWVSPVAFVIFLISLGMALLKIAYDTRRAGEGMNAIVRSLVTTLAGGLPILAVTMLGIQFGDEFSPWVLSQASGQDTSNGFGTIFVTAFMGSPTGTPAASGALLIIYLLAILGSIAQCVFMVVRGAMVIVLLSFSQVTAAGTATDEGWLRFKRIGMLLVGFVLYKPVAAVIYGIGLKLMSDGATTSQQLMNAIYGLTILILAALALPAVIKFVAPAAAMGSSSAFSGGAALGAVAAGATVVALAGATGGAGAAAGAGGASAGAGSSAAGSAGAPGGGTGGAAGGGTGGAAGGGVGGGAGEAAGGATESGAAASSSGGGTANEAGREESGPASGSGPRRAADEPAGSQNGAEAPRNASQNGSGNIGAGGSQNGTEGGSSGGVGAAPANPSPAESNGAAGGQTNQSGGHGAEVFRAGAQTVQSIAGQMNQGVDDASRDS